MNRLEYFFPLNTLRCTVRRLTYNDIKWYTRQVKSDYFNEYLDNTSNGVKDFLIKTKLTSLVASYKLTTQEQNEVRLVIDVGGKQVGGITIYNDDIYNIAYWILPKHQGKGIAREVLTKITKEIDKNVIGLSGIRLDIQERNTGSIALAEKTGFVCIKTYEGKNCLNRIYEYKREE